MKSLYKKLSDKPEIFKRYDKILKDELKKGVAEKESQSNNGRVSYIPHFAVINLDKNSSKIQTVYDASAKTKKGKKSLNECLHQRPVILEDLAELLMRFRTKTIGLIADIERAFPQVRLQHEDRDVTTLL